MVGENGARPLPNQMCQDGRLGIQPPLASHGQDHTHLRVEWGLLCTNQTSTFPWFCPSPPLSTQSTATSWGWLSGTRLSRPSPQTVMGEGLSSRGLTASGLSPGSRALLSGRSSVPANPSAVLSEYIWNPALPSLWLWSPSHFLSGSLCSLSNSPSCFRPCCIYSGLNRATTVIIFKSIQNPLVASHITEWYHSLRSIGTLAHLLPLPLALFLLVPSIFVSLCSYGLRPSSTLQVQGLLFCLLCLGDPFCWSCMVFFLPLLTSLCCLLNEAFSIWYMTGPYCFHPVSSPPSLPVLYNSAASDICFAILWNPWG